MARNLITTLADNNFIEPAKQLFSSIFHKSGWNGDYMLLSYNIPEKKLDWFRNKGILIKKCQPLYAKRIGLKNRPPIVISKFYLFTEEFKKWDNIVYIDADATVRAALNELADVKGFAAVQSSSNLRQQFDCSKMIKSLKVEQSYQKLKKRYNLNSKAFNSGVMAFSTKIIKKETFFKLLATFHEYNTIHTHGDQPTLNLHFYKKWRKLPNLYNIRPDRTIEHSRIKPQNLKGIILHFRHWATKDYFLNEWKQNLDDAELIDLSKRKKALKSWRREEIIIYSMYLKGTQLIDRTVGLIGIWLRYIFPAAYFRLKSMLKPR